MPLFNNCYLRYFTGGFLAGALVIAVAGKSDSVKDLKFESVSGRAVFTGTSAWIIWGTLMGFLAGTAGLGIAGLKKRIERA